MSLLSAFGVRMSSATEKGNGLLNAGSEDLHYLECFKVFRAKFESRAGMRLKVVAITSAIAGEGKTSTGAHLAENLASGGRRKVLLVDADFRKADLSRGMGIPTEPGFSDFLNGTVGMNDIIRPSSKKGLHLIPTGSEVENPANLFAGEKFQTFLKKVREDFDFVILDTPPVLPVADTITMRESVDGFIFVLRAGFTPVEMFQSAIAELGADKVIGAVLNGVELMKEKHYQKYYGSYYYRQTAPRRDG